MDLFIPKYAINLKDLLPRVRLGVQGDSGTGKSEGAMSFPNPVPVDFDGNLTRFYGMGDQPSIPFHSHEFMKKYKNGAYIGKKAFPDNMNNVKDAALDFVYNDAKLFSPEQTLIFDSFSSIMDNMNNWYCANPVMVYNSDAKEWVEDTRKMYDQIKDYAIMFFTGIKMLECNVVVTFHDHKPRDKNTGQIDQNKIAPLMVGSYKDQIKKNFTEFLRTELKDGKYMLQVKSNSKFDPVVRKAIKPKEEYFDMTNPKCMYDFFRENLPAK